MNIEQLIETRKQEIKELNKFRSYIQMLDENAELSNETISEFKFKINIRISQCEICIREYQKDIER